MKIIDATLRVMAISIIVSLILTTHWGTALGEYHHVDGDYGGVVSAMTWRATNVTVTIISRR